MAETLTGLTVAGAIGAVASPACHDRRTIAGQTPDCDLGAHERTATAGRSSSCWSCPLVVFVLPALLGHPAVTGDNQIQNYPLRVLSGQMLRAGHLPLWDPWIWSGTPLLGGLNAGSLYPGTWLYAMLPGLVAWTVNLVFVYWVAAAGYTCSPVRTGFVPLASAIGAASFSFVGSMTAQIVHLGVVQGAAWIPWMVVGELRLALIFLPGTATRVEGEVLRTRPHGGTRSPGFCSPDAAAA